MDIRLSKRFKQVIMDEDINKHIEDYLFILRVKNKRLCTRQYCNKAMMGRSVIAIESAITYDDTVMVKMTTGERQSINK